MPCYNDNSEHKHNSKKPFHFSNNFDGKGCAKPYLDNTEDYFMIDKEKLLPFLEDNGHADFISKIPEKEKSDLAGDKLYITGRYSVSIKHTPECMSFKYSGIKVFQVAVSLLYKITG